MYQCSKCNWTCDNVGTRIQEILAHEKTHEIGDDFPSVMDE